MKVYIGVWDNGEVYDHFQYTTGVFETLTQAETENERILAEDHGGGGTTYVKEWVLGGREVRTILRDGKVLVHGKIED